MILEIYLLNMHKLDFKNVFMFDTLIKMHILYEFANEFFEN